MLTCSCTCAASRVVPLHRVILSVMTTPPPRSPSVDELPAVVARLLVALAMSYHRRRDRLRLFSPGISSHRAHIRHGFPLPPLPGLRRSFLVLLSVSSLCGCEARARASRTSRACRARVLCVRRLWTVALFCIGACRAGIHVSLCGICSAHVSTIFRLGVTKRSLA